jgi:hypothetical protein
LAADEFFIRVQGAYTGDGFPSTLTGHDDPKRLTGAAVTPGVFTTLGVRPFLGRYFIVDDQRASAPGVVILSHALWQSEFGSDPAILGTPLRFDDATYSVIGVMPAGFLFPNPNVRFWKPVSDSLVNDSNRGNNVFEVLAKPQR